MATAFTTTTVGPESITGVDPELVAGCHVYRDCPQVAEWMVFYAGVRLNTVCEHHRRPFIELVRGVQLNVDQVRFIRI